MNNTHDLSKAQLDHIMSGIGIYDYYLKKDFNTVVNIDDKRKFKTGYYCEVDQSRWSDINKGASNYMINSIHIEKKASGKPDKPKIILKYTNSQVTYSPHSIQRYIERGNTMPKISDLHMRLPSDWSYPHNRYGVKNVMLPVESGAFIGSIYWSPGLVTNIDSYDYRYGHLIQAHYPLQHKQNNNLYVPDNNLPQHTTVANHEYHYLAFNASTYLSYDQLNTQQATIFDLHFYDPVASWELQKQNMGDFMTKATQKLSNLSISDMLNPNRQAKGQPDEPTDIKLTSL